MALDNELGALDAGGIGHIDRGSLTIVRTAGDLADSVRLGMEHIGLGKAFVIFADILEAYGGAVVSVGDDSLILDDEDAYLPALAVGVFCPDTCHAKVALVEY